MMSEARRKHVGSYVGNLSQGRRKPVGRCRVETPIPLGAYDALQGRHHQYMERFIC